jgi:hypothetical protein
VQDSSDPEGLRVFYYLVQDLKALVFSLISLHFKASMPQDMARCTAHNACRSSPSKLQSRNRTNSVEGYVGDRDSRPPAEYGVWNLLGDLGRSVPPCRPCAPMKRREYQNSGKLLERASRASWESRRAPQHTRALGLKQYRIKNAMVVVQAAGGVGVGEWTSRDLQRQTPA